MVTDVLSRRFVLLSTLDAKLLGFEHIKGLYANDHDFSIIYTTCEEGAFNKFYRHEDCFFREGKLYVPQNSMRELLVKESYSGGLMGYFGVIKTLDILTEYFYWPNMKRDVERICSRCVTCNKAKSKMMPHGLYTPLFVPSRL